MIFHVFQRHPRKSVFSQKNFPSQIFASFLAGYDCIPCTYFVFFFLFFFFPVLQLSLLKAQGDTEISVSAARGSVSLRPWREAGHVGELFHVTIFLHLWN